MQTIKLTGTGQHTTVKVSKKEHMKKIIDEENLDSPKDSVEFLQYVKKHQQKVKQH